jgi:hypothetical protein
MSATIIDLDAQRRARRGARTTTRPRVRGAEHGGVLVFHRRRAGGAAPSSAPETM